MPQDDWEMWWYSFTFPEVSDLAYVAVLIYLPDMLLFSTNLCCYLCQRFMFPLHFHKQPDFIFQFIDRIYISFQQPAYSGVEKKNLEIMIHVFEQFFKERVFGAPVLTIIWDFHKRIKQMSWRSLTDKDISVNHAVDFPCLEELAILLFLKKNESLILTQQRSCTIRTIPTDVFPL